MSQNKTGEDGKGFLGCLRCLEEMGGRSLDTYDENALFTGMKLSKNN